MAMTYLDGLDLSGDAGGSECDDHASCNRVSKMSETLEGKNGRTANDASFHATDGNRANTADLVHILEGQTEGLVGGTLGRVDAVNGLEQGLAGALGLGLLLPALVPGAVGGGLDHVVAVEAGDGDEGHGLGVVANLLDEVGGLLDDLVEPILRPLGGVHLVDGDDELLDTQGVGEQGVLTGLTVLGDTSLELTGAGSDDEDGAVGLGGTSDHVLDEVTVAGGVNDGDIVPRGLELPEGDIDRDTTLTLGLQLVEHPGVLEGTLAKLGGFLWGIVSADGSWLKCRARRWGGAGGGDSGKCGR
jgi:hypothetical protein